MLHLSVFSAQPILWELSIFINNLFLRVQNVTFHIRFWGNIKELECWSGCALYVRYEMLQLSAMGTCVMYKSGLDIKPVHTGSLWT